MDDFIDLKGFFCMDIQKEPAGIGGLHAWLISILFCEISSQKKRPFGRSDKDQQAGKSMHPVVHRGH